MAAIYVNDKGTWKLPKSIWVKDGQWRVCKNVYIRENGSWRELIKTVTITSNQNNFNLYNYVGKPKQPLNLIVTIPANVTISSYDVLPTGGYQNQTTYRYNIKPRTNAFTVGAFPKGSTVLINNNGYISGGGGFGGSGANKASNSTNYPNISAAKGGDGSYGIIKGGSGYTCTVVNNGTIAGGGGGGGGSGGTEGYDGPINFVRTGFWDGGDGAGVTGYSKSIGQSIAPPSYGGTTNGDGKGGNCSKDGATGYTFGGNAQWRNGNVGGKGKPAIGSGIEVAVSGNILGEVG